MSILRNRPAARVVALVLVYGALIFMLSRVTADLNVGSDFVEYWTAARLVLAGQIPFDAASVGAVQHDLGFQLTQPTMMYNPPWVLAVTLPVSFLPYQAALMLWLTILFVSVLACSLSCWRLYGGPSNK